MRILIIENEVYLAQSIASKLASLGHECEILTNIKDVLKVGKKDAVLLSTSVFGENIYPVIDKFKDSIIILLITYINNDTVSKPIKAGASDYIQKPFMVEELIRKLHHFEEFDKIKNINKSYTDYFTSYFSSLPKQDLDIKKLKFPFFVASNSQILADKFVFEVAKRLNLGFKIIFLNSPNALENLENENFNSPLYLINFQNLKESDKTKLTALIQKRQVIVSTTQIDENVYFEKIVLEERAKEQYGDKILSVDEYFKNIISLYQGIFPDTELSKKLGISRKSLWEKRKKYGIVKKK